ncbi:Gfo/Idh/MocA family oxidoreductase [Teredinibacter sp. KSP-S5-2]|uniref:Gfo/Idh/MocA family protein n=1 Tax=Teredinibacter sp. KSP-S5-2 TaxID=3034506 RepID=UPI0029342CFB|nr:Gfo/Idh/MocA family oxidoreductase [Teredinibacter sp. KSP-S5-2]WNO08361.1 Gfo/Idh/MocA family oxidoreductase [Teredinibacter sp. KSP-S5-2]
MLKLAIIGAGNIARIRARALLKTGQIELCGVAAHRQTSAEKFARDFSIPFATDNYKELSNTKPDAFLLEVPHQIQDEAAIWTLQQKCHLLIGGCLATSSAVGKQIIHLANKYHSIVECGYEARYKACWQKVKQYLRDKEIGLPLTVNAIALWQPPPNSWYTQQTTSGGMPVTHMTYAFINPLRWLFGHGVHISTQANALEDYGNDSLKENLCITQLKFPGELLASLTAGFVSALPAKRWHLDVVGTKGIIEIHPGDLDEGSLIIHQGQGDSREESFDHAINAFDGQAAVFVESCLERQNDMHSISQCLNPPEDAIKDIKLTESITHFLYRETKNEHALA